MVTPWVSGLIFDTIGCQIHRGCVIDMLHIIVTMSVCSKLDIARNTHELKDKKYTPPGGGYLKKRFLLSLYIYYIYYID